MIHAAFLIPLFPLVGFLILAPFGRRIGNPIAGWIATLMVLASFVVTVLVFAGVAGEPVASRLHVENWFTWLNSGQLSIGVGIQVDPLSLTMAMFITGISTLIHCYSVGYMKLDEQFSKFFVYLNLFVFSMLMLVLGENLVITFLGWEGVGVCSYFLIAFWFTRPSAASAGKKAMIYNRVGDGGFLLALFLLIDKLHSLTFTTIFSHLSQLSPTDLTAVSLLLFVGAVGKSAQLPLFPWLADAMEGPTPVSALIHAATMVTAGVYLMCRVNPILHLVPNAGHLIAWIGVATAFIAATIGCAQTDIKKVLAYSTVSQLGYMFLAVGCGAYDAAIFLMLTHAFYKALLFLASGSVIHAMDDEQDIKNMGALRRAMPLTSATFFIGWLSIAGIPPFSGFWAKGDVLSNAWVVSPALWAVGAVTAILTAYYMGRQYLLVFLGEPRWKKAGAGSLHPHDASWQMSMPLVVLAVLASFGGLINLPFGPHLTFLESWLAPVVGSGLLHNTDSTLQLWMFGVADAVFAIGGATIALSLWRNVVNRPALEPQFLFMAWFLDASIDRFIARPSSALALFSARVVDRQVIDGAVNGVAGLFKVSAGRLRRLQTGYVRTYALVIISGLVIMVAYFMIRSGL
ncbi:MAG TPA: NADH-quinone oxidoreductase subunit L [Acidimicrobiales bacterium]|nr:NADH-quinone oxidoreductase subunit L [Acidimicrobiales bacterium]